MKKDPFNRETDRWINGQIKTPVLMYSDSNGRLLVQMLGFTLHIHHIIENRSCNEKVEELFKEDDPLLDNQSADQGWMRGSEKENDRAIYRRCNNNLNKRERIKELTE